jgi:hypothetical protein
MILCYYCGKQNKINLEKTIDTGKAMCFNCKAELITNRSEGLIITCGHCRQLNGVPKVRLKNINIAKCCNCGKKLIENL